MSKTNLKNIDSGFIERVQAGDQEAYRELLNMIYPYVQFLVRKKVGGLIEVEDLTQECVLGVHKSLVTFQPGKAFTPWLHAIVKFKICDYFRAKNRKISVGESEPQVAETTEFNEEYHNSESVGGQQNVTNYPSAENALMEHEHSSQLWGWVDTLPEKLKTVIILTKKEGLSTQEAAERAGVSEAALRKRLSRAYRKLAEVLENKMEFDLA